MKITAVEVTSDLGDGRGTWRGTYAVHRRPDGSMYYRRDSGEEISVASEATTPDTARMDWLEEGLRTKRPRFHIPEGGTFRKAIDEEMAREKCSTGKCGVRK